MIFSMNGFRRQLSGDVKTLKDIIERVLNNDFYEEEDLIDAVNNVITHSNVVNCVFDNENPDFNDMSEIEVDHIEPKG
jgi:hypothetical protein